MREALRNEMCTSLLPTPSPPSLPPSPPPASLGVRDLLVLQIIEHVLGRLPAAISEEELRARRGGVADESSQFEPLAAFFIREVRIVWLKPTTCTPMRQLEDERLSVP